jgi:hypothetical protein
MYSASGTGRVRPLGDIRNVRYTAHQFFVPCRNQQAAQHPAPVVGRAVGYAGTVSREHSSGPRIRRGSISKAGNAHLRRIVTEAAWSYRHRPNLGATLIARQSGQSEAIKTIAWRAQHRLHVRYRALMARGKPKQKVITALARELLGFLWEIGCELEGSVAKEARRAA